MRPDEGNEKCDELFRGLEQAAGRLDQQKFPGTAWAGPNHSLRPVLYKIVASTLGIAAAIVLVVHYWPVSNVSSPRPSGMVKVPAPKNIPTALPPRIIIVEDLDSYSIIDLSAGSAIVSFASKNSHGLPPSLVVVGGEALEPATRNSHL